MTHALPIADSNGAWRLQQCTHAIYVLTLCVLVCACQSTKKEQTRAQPVDEEEADADASVAVSNSVDDASLVRPTAPTTVGSERERALVDLSTAELDKLCTWSLELLVAPTKRQLCTFLSLQAASEVACNAAVYACEKTQPVAMDPPLRCDSRSVKALPSRCASVSVAEYEACAKAAAKASNERFAQVSCKKVAPDASARATAPPDACLALNEACPELAPKGSGARAPWSGGSFLCDDGWPLFAEEVCNGVQDCAAGEDERGC